MTRLRMICRYQSRAERKFLVGILTVDGMPFERGCVPQRTPPEIVTEAYRDNSFLKTKLEVLRDGWL